MVAMLDTNQCGIIQLVHHGLTDKAFFSAKDGSVFKGDPRNFCAVSELGGQAGNFSRARSRSEECSCCNLRAALNDGRSFF
jgi:hypothetical protein